MIRCGEAFLPMDPSWPKARVLSIIASSNVDLVIASKFPFGVESDSKWIAESGNFRVLWFSLEAEEEGNGNENSPDLDWPCEEREQRPFCYVMYTSGSTGKPKGVCGTEQGLLNRFLWMQELYPLSGEEVLLFKTSISFIDHLQEFLSALLTACTLVIPPFNQLKQNVFSIVHFIQAYSINRLTAVPSLMRAILPSSDSRYDIGRVSLPSLKLLVLSGEMLPISLWDSLSKILPGTSILNLYGSTEVSGDCTYFDCKRLPKILESETLTSVPIGTPIVNCDVVLVGDDDLAKHGEIYVSGLCNSTGYYSDSTCMPLDQVKLLREYAKCGSANGHGDKLYFQTGDFAKRLQGGDLVFLGRKDRTIKLNGQRIALEEIEDELRGHPDVINAAVISHKVQGEISLLVAFLILEKESNDILGSHMKRWLLDKLPSAMVPNCFINAESFPTTSSGKVDYESLTSEFLKKHAQNEIGDIGNVNLLQVIKKAFCDVLMVEEVSDDDDFFMMGGTSIAAAHFSNNLGIDMRLLYQFPSPSKLCTTLFERKTSLDLDLRKDANWEMNLKEGKRNLLHPLHASYSTNMESELKLLRTRHGRNENHVVSSKRLKLNSEVTITSEGFTFVNAYPWNAASMCFSCSFSRCNKFIYKGDDGMNGVHQENRAEVPRRRKIPMQELWKVYLGSCVDASPLIVFKGPDIHLFIGSHSHEFLCVNAQSGRFS